MSEPLIITVSDTCFDEKSWIISVLIHDFLGCHYKLVKSSHCSSVQIAKDNKQLIINDSGFELLHTKWMTESSLPSTPLANLTLDSLPFKVTCIENNVPIVYGSGQCEVNQNHIQLGLDIFASSFYFLSRYEEVIHNERDSHDRFQLSSCVAYQEGFYDRPIVNEYLEILWASMAHLWPDLVRKSRDSRIKISCDVDRPYECSNRNFKSLITQLNTDISRSISISNFLRHIKNYLLFKFKFYKTDPYYRFFDWIMSINETKGNRVAFYFIVDSTEEIIDPCYKMSDQPMQQLLKSIHARGHEIGLHPSYHSYKDYKQLILETNRLKEHLDRLNIMLDRYGSRQHYLRWDTAITPSLIDSTDVEYDTTLGFSEMPGFRCGVCYEYTMYDLIDRKPLKLTQLPLIVMEQSLLSPAYMDLQDPDQVIETIIKLKNKCYAFNGDFTLLWHNSNLGSQEQRYIYEKVI